RIRSSPSGHLAQGVKYVQIFIVQSFRAAFAARHRQTVGETINRDYTLGPKQIGAADRHLPHAAAAPNGDNIAGLNITHIGGHESGGKRVGYEYRLLI